MIDQLGEDAWVDIDFLGTAQVAEIGAKGTRLIVRRVRKASVGLQLFTH